MHVLSVSVTDEDIQHGLRQDCIRCPIAIATTRAARVAYDDENIVARVNPTSIELYECGTDADADVLALDGGHGQYIAGFTGCSTPPSARNAMHNFDQGINIHPISFVIVLDY